MINSPKNSPESTKKRKNSFDDSSFQNMIYDNVLDPDDPDPPFTDIAGKVNPVSHAEMKNNAPTYHIDDFWGKGQPLPEAGKYNRGHYPILNQNQKRVNGGKKQKTNKKIKSKKNKKRSKRTRKNRKSKK